MKKLHEERVGLFEGQNDKEKVFYKKLPTQNNKELISKHVDFNDYESNFKMSIEHMTATQMKTRAQIRTKNMDMRIQYASFYSLITFSDAP